MKKNVEMKVGPYILRTIVREDIETLRQLRNASREFFLTTQEVDAEAQERWYERYSESESDLMFVAVRDGNVVGMAGLSGGPDTVEFGRLVVAESERRRGLGFAITAKLMAWTFSTGSRVVRLMVRSDNGAARTLYERLGFLEERREERGEDEYIWMQATPSETEKWQSWDRPGVAEQIVSYWSSSRIEQAHKAWLADVVLCGARQGTVLEAGCGSGDIFAALRSVPQVSGYIGVDTSRAMLAIGKIAHPEARLKVQDLRQLDRVCADTVVCFDVLGHLPGDLVPELRSIIGAAKDTAIVALWVSKAPATRRENVADVTFLHNSRTHAAVLRAIYTAAPDCRVVQHRGYGENIAYVIRAKAPPLHHSVIIGSYNRPSYVRKAIRSVMEQSYRHWEVIVTDDGSTEETQRAILETFGDDPRCRLIVASDKLPDGPRPSGNVRAVERINDAIKLVTGDIVHYLPDDDWFLPGRFEAFNESFRDPDVMMTYGEMRYADGDVISPTDRIYPGGDVQDPWCQLDQTQVAHRASCFTKVPKWAIENIGYAADGVFYRDLCKAGYGPVRPFPTPVSVHRRHAFNMQKGKESATDKRED